MFNNPVIGKVTTKTPRVKTRPSRRGGVIYIVAILLTVSYRRRLGVGRLSFIALDVLAPLALLLVGYLTCLYALQPGNFILTLTIETWRGNASGIMGIPMLLGVIAIAIVIATLT